MNKSIIAISCFVLGVSSGALIARQLLKTKYEQIAQDEINSVKEFYRGHDVVKKEEVVDDEGAYIRQKEIYKPSNKPLSYHLMAKPSLEELAAKTYPGEEIGEEFYDHQRMSEDANMRDYTEPYVINVGEFSDEKEHFDKLTIYYYEDDDTLADEREEIIVDPDALIGADALTCFGETAPDNDDPDVVYVRNEKMNVDYEIICLHKSYQETVLGILPEPVRRKNHEQGRE